MSDTLSALDAAFLELEQADQGASMSIGGTMVFDRSAGGPPSLEDLETLLSARLGALRRYSQRLSSLRAGHFFWPRWEPDPHFEIGHHIRRAALPAPGGDRQLCDWTAEFFSHPLDRARPLWELVLLEGLEGGRWALAHKVHHCLVDGVGSVDVVGVLLDDRAGGRSDSVSLAAPPDSITLAPDASPSGFPQPLIRAARAAAHTADATMHAVAHPGRTADRSLALLDLLVHDELAGSPRSSLNVPIGQARRYAVVRAPLAELKAVGRVLGGSFNDVMLAACAGGLRRLLVERGESLPARGLRAMVPVNVRTDSDEPGLGNRVSSLFVELPVDEPVAAVRFARIAARTRRLKAGRAALGPTTMMDLAGLAPPLVSEAAISRTEFSTRLFNVTITNVPGSPDPLYAFGARLREVLPVVPLASHHALGIAIFSYNGMVSVGLNADRESMPDLGVLIAGIEESLDELRSVVPAMPDAADE